MEIDNLFIHQPLQLFPPRQILLPYIALHVEIKECRWEGLGGGLVLWVVVCVQVGVFEALLDRVALFGIDYIYQRCAAKAKTGTCKTINLPYLDRRNGGMTRASTAGSRLREWDRATHM